RPPEEEEEVYSPQGMEERLTGGGASVVPEQELGERAIEPYSAGSMDIMMEERNKTSRAVKIFQKFGIKHKIGALRTTMRCD
ncbi:hypothetical protein GBF38_010669, partial [Nibea albiflora]